MRALCICASGLLFLGCQRVDSNRATSLDDHAKPTAPNQSSPSSVTTDATPPTADGAPNVATPDATTPPPAPLAPTSPGSTNDTAAIGEPVLRPDNSGVNERDRGANTKTPFDQGENEADRKTTAEIRQRIVNADNMSINARNVKIVTANGKVTLRGPVNSAAEHDSIVRFARDIAGANNVDDQLEVAAANTASPTNP
jgi:hyperosmotically inducible periplasmic protein